MVKGAVGTSAAPKARNKVAKGKRVARNPWIRLKKARPGPEGRQTPDAPRVCRPCGARAFFLGDPGAARATHAGPWLPYGRAFGATRAALGTSPRLRRYQRERLRRYMNADENTASALEQTFYEGETGVLVRLPETKREGTDLPQDQCPCLYLSSPMEN